MSKSIKLKNDIYVDSSSVIHARNPLSYYLRKYENKIIELNNVNGGTPMTYTFNVTRNSSVLVLSTGGIRYKVFLWDVNKKKYYPSTYYDICDVSGGMQPLIEIDESGFYVTVTIYAWQHATVIIN